MTKEVGFYWNPILGTIEEQANEQGFTLGEKAKIINDYQMNLFSLHVNGIITDSQYDKIVQKLQKHTVKLLKPIDKEVKNGN